MKKLFLITMLFPGSCAKLALFRLQNDAGVSHETR